MSKIHCRKLLINMITLKDVVDKLALEVKAGKTTLTKQVKGGYASDLLSDVMANSEPGSIWVTLQLHMNIVAVATLKELAGIILVNGREPDKETIEKAEEEGIFIASSSLPAFELIGRMYEMGIAGVP